jgi:hypothetical protein
MRYEYKDVFETASEEVGENGDRHVRNALKHYAEGRPEFAAGSMKKALRNYERAARIGGGLYVSERVVEKLAGWRLKAQVIFERQRLAEDEPKQRERI